MNAKASGPSSLGGFLARRTVAGAATIVAVPALSFIFWSVQIEDAPWSLGGDSPSVLSRLATYLQDTFVHFDLGRATDLGAVPVSQTIREGMPVDLALVVGAMVLGTLGGLAGGIACARRRRSLLARALRGAAVLALCIPVYSAALLVLITISRSSRSRSISTGRSGTSARPSRAWTSRSCRAWSSWRPCSS